MAGQFSLPRLIFAGAVALTVVVSGIAAAPSSDLTAGPSTCTVTQSNSSSSVVCLPGTPPGMGGQPSAQDLTNQNSYRSHGGGLLGPGGLL